MPPIFKALATIMVWVLWIAGLVMGFSVFIHGIILGVIYGPEPAPMEVTVGFAVALAYGVGAVVVMILRKKIE
ncbi:MAG: hypothetical protein HY530_04455 [Chloroflexi bacterium]|nr:hypothetical protein [Chloroflexota bacterium]